MKQLFTSLSKILLTVTMSFSAVNAVLSNQNILELQIVEVKRNFIQKIFDGPISYKYLYNKDLKIANIKYFVEYGELPPDYFSGKKI